MLRGKQVRKERVPRIGLLTNHDLASVDGLFLLPDTLFPTSHSSTQILRRGAEVPSSEKASLKFGVGCSSGVSEPLQDLSIPSSRLRGSLKASATLPHFPRGTGGT